MDLFFYIIMSETRYREHFLCELFVVRKINLIIITLKSTIIRIVLNLVLKSISQSIIQS